MSVTGVQVKEASPPTTSFLNFNWTLLQLVIQTPLAFERCQLRFGEIILSIYFYIVYLNKD